MTSTTRSINNSTSDNDCSVCLEHLDGDVGACVPCGHVFHLACFERWRGESSPPQARCPNCNERASQFVKLFVNLSVPPPSSVTAAAVSSLESDNSDEQHQDASGAYGRDRYGCFVYQCLSRYVNGIAVRRLPSDSNDFKTDTTVKPHELVCVDYIRQSPNPSSGPFLRLADCSGWMFERKYDSFDPVVQELPVRDGLWTFFADNYPAGIGLRRHPNDRKDNFVEPKVKFLPMQKIVCDKHVQNNKGVNFYRVQGMNGWVFDTRGNDRFMMLPESKVLHGLFVYKARKKLAVRDETNVGDDSKTSVAVDKDELVAVDVVRESPFGATNGPFLRLTDGTGWLFVKKKSKVVMDPVPLEEGHWVLRIDNAPAGIALRRQPIDSKYTRVHPKRVFSPNERIVCDYKVSNGVTNFFRVKGTNGWVFDRRGEITMLTVVEERIYEAFQHRSTKRRRIDKVLADEDVLRNSLRVIDKEMLVVTNKRARTLEQLNEHNKRESDSAKLQKEKEKTMKQEVIRLKENIEKERKAAKTLLERKKRGDKITSLIFHPDEISLYGSSQLFAMGGRASLMLTEDYGWSYTPGLPDNVRKLLQTRALSHPRPKYVALGSRGRYFISFANGKRQWSGNETSSFDDIVRNKAVEFVAFGNSLTSYVVSTPECIHWNNVPKQLERILKGTNPVHSVSLGPLGEYFVAFKSGDFKGGGWSNELNSEIGRLKRDGFHVRDVKFGNENSYIVRYSSYSGPF